VALRTPLYDEHIALGAKMFEFSGWEMPLWYGTITQEHMAVRSSAGIFDVSHMGKILAEGEEGMERLDWLFTRSLTGSRKGRALYSFLLDDSGHIIDDLIATRVSEHGFLIVCNAAKREAVLHWLSANVGGASVTDMTVGLACLAVQGPSSGEIVSGITDLDIYEMKRFKATKTRMRIVDTEREDAGEEMHWASGIEAETEPKGAEALISRTGYTGEDGFEIIMNARTARELWKRILDTGGQRIRPCGLGARDTLRLEMCYLLSGHDFDGGQTPLEAGEDKAIDWNHDFRGKEALLRQRQEEYPRLVAFISVGSGVPREGYEIFSLEKERIGRITSGTLSPVLKKGVGMGYVGEEYSSPGTTLYYGIGGRRIEAVVVEKPFLKR